MSCWILIFSSYRRNIGSDLKTCVYDPDKDPLCPIIKLGTIVKQAGQDYNKLAFEVKNTLFCYLYLAIISIVFMQMEQGMQCFSPLYVFQAYSSTCSIAVQSWVK